MSTQTIESQDLTLGQLFTEFYAVPTFQREYVWEETQVEQLLNDVYGEFVSEGRHDTSEYFIGSIVVCARPDGVFDLIDGQQRMTTTYLTLCAIRDHLKSLKPPTAIDALSSQISASDVNDRGEDVFRYRVTLQYDDSGDVLGVIAQGEGDTTNIPHTTRSVENILNALQTIRAFLLERFGSDVAAIRRYYTYFTKNVKLIRVKTVSLTHALKVFETINDRGVGLDSMDLLKNLMFIEARQSDYEMLKDEWKKLVDTLHNAHEKPLRFLRYFIFARYGVDRLSEEEIYKWFITNKDLSGYGARPLLFIRELLAYARAYAHFIAGEDSKGKSNRYLQNLALLSGTARQHLILLLAGQELNDALFTELCRQVENLYFAYVITRSDTRDFERLFARWAKEVREIDTRPALDAFIAQRFLHEREALSAQFGLAFSQLTETSLQKYRLRYVLAKLAQYVDERAYPGQERVANLRNYISKIEIEHILPQNPDPEVIKAFDKSDEILLYIHQLGNLALLEKPINSSIGNGPFSAKQPIYCKSQLLLTKSLGEEISVGKGTSIDRAALDLEIFSAWTSVEIERRQAMLGHLAHYVWDMPVVTRSGETSNQNTSARGA